MSAKGSQFAVDASAAVKLADGLFVTITNHDATNSVFLGGSSVTSATGYELKPGLDVQVDASLDSVFGICAATKTARVDVLGTRRAYA